MILSGFYVYQRPTFVLHENPLFHHNIESKKISESWTDFIADCGGTQILENSVHTKMVFNEKYENNEISWSGYFGESKARRSGFWMFGNDHYVSLLIKM